LAKGPAYKVKFRRARKGLTDYRRRKRLVSSGVPRLVIRKTNMYIQAALVLSKPEGDFTVCRASSVELKKMGWPLGLSNVMASYLTGLMCGLRAKAKGLVEAIPDIGLHRHSRGGNAYALCKGVADAGLKVRLDESVLPSEDRIRGKHIASYYAELSSLSQETMQFSSYKRRGVDPASIDKVFEEAKAKVLQAFGGSVGDA
jgi:large subunit ribosomal protein L18